MSKKVFIGSGHGGSDPGAVANGFKEKDLNLAIALACNEVLVRHGVVTMMSKTTDEDDPYSETIPQCNAFAPDVAVEIHNNAGGGDGAEVYHSKRDSSDDALAKNVLDAIVAIGQNSRGMKTKELSDGGAYFAWIRNLNAPAVLVECAFMDTKDIEIIDTPAEQKAMGVAIAKGILKTIGIAYKEPVVATPVVSATVSVGSLVEIVSGATYYNGFEIPTWVRNKRWYVSEVSGDRAVINKSEDGKNAINSPVNVKYLSVVGAAKKTPEIGDVVNFAGGKHYTGSNSIIGFNAKAGSAKITNIVKNAKHPYHLVKVSGGGSNVYGWVNADTIK